MSDESGVNADSVRKLILQIEKETCREPELVSNAVSRLMTKTMTRIGQGTAMLIVAVARL